MIELLVDDVASGVGRFCSLMVVMQEQLPRLLSHLMMVDRRSPQPSTAAAAATVRNFQRVREAVVAVARSTLP